MNSSSGSFIPQNPVQKAGGKKRVRRIYVVSYVIYIFFTITILVAIGLWVYAQMLSGQLLAAQETLAAEQQQFQTEDFDQLREFDERLTRAAAVLNNQISSSQLFAGIEEVLLSFAQVEAFEFDNSTGAVRVTLRTTLPDFNAALFQRQVLEQHSLFNDAVIENITYATASNDTEAEEVIVAYDIAATIDRQNLQDFTALASTDDEFDSSVLDETVENEAGLEESEFTEETPDSVEPSNE